MLLSEDGLARRRDAVVDIGAALEAKAGGSGHLQIAAGLGVPATTVRGWLRRFAQMAGDVREHFTRWAAALDPMLGVMVGTGSAFADAAAAIGVTAAAAATGSDPARLGHWPRC